MGTWVKRITGAGVAVAMGDAEVLSATPWIGSEEMTIAILGRLVCSWSTPIGACCVFEV